MNTRNPFPMLLAMLLLIVSVLISTDHVNAQILGIDWTGTFFNNTTLIGEPVATSTFPDGLSCNWSEEVNNCAKQVPVPIPGVNQTQFSGTFTSTQEFTELGPYTFTLRYNDGLRLTINEVVVHDDFNQQLDPDAIGACQDLCKEVRVTVNITEPEVAMRADYVQYTDAAILQIQWGFNPDAESLLVNGGFENELAGWTLKNGTGDKVKCNTDAKTFAHEGECAFRFKGSADENAKLVNTGNTVLFTSTSLTLDGYVKASGKVKSSVKVIVSYPNSDQPKDKWVIDIPGDTGGSYAPLSNFVTSMIVPVNDHPAKVKLMLVNKGNKGKVFYDSLSLTTNVDVTRNLPLHPLPQP